MYRRLISLPRPLIAGTAVVAGACAAPTVGLLESAPSPSFNAARPESQLPAIRPRMADTALAGMGLWGGCSSLCLLERMLQVRLFAPPMMASGIIFFFGPSPPDPYGFLSGTLCAATISFATLAAASRFLPPVTASGAAAAAMLVWYKSTSTMFPPAAVLAGTLLGTISAGPAGSFALVPSLSYLAFPWLAGHAWLYACALMVSQLRASARIATTQRRLQSLHDQPDDVLRNTFATFDTSGDGALDAAELKVALRAALGLEVSYSDCTALIAIADKDGTGACDFDEFKAICQQQL